MTDAMPDPAPDHDTPPDGGSVAAEVDFDEIERDLAAVEVALQRLSDGTYWTDEVTGQPIPEPVLTADPTARRV